MANSLYEYGQIADVIIRPKYDMNLGGKDYKAQTPYTVLHDINFNLQYEQNTASANGIKPIISTQNARPYRVVITGCELTDKVLDLVATRVDKKEHLITRYKTCYGSGDCIYVSDHIATDKFVFVFNKNHEPVLDWTVEDTKIVGDFKQDEQYLVFYPVAQESKVFSFEMPHYGYFELEVHLKGNTDKHTHDLYLFFPAVSLVTTPTFDALNGDIFNTPLLFDIIYHGQTEPHMVIC